MKNLIFLSFFFILSCSTRKNENIYQVTQNIQPQLSQDEINIVSDFLDAELATDRYKNYRNLEIVVIEESLKKTQAIEAYEYTYKDWNAFGEKGTLEENERLGFILDTLEIKTLKNKHLKDENFYWKITDFKSYKVSIMKNETLRNIINSGEYIKLPEKLILYISRPLMIDENKSLISFNIGSSELGYRSMNHYTALMKKINEKWIIKASYDDGVYY